jgi:hypothetical protein
LSHDYMIGNSSGPYIVCSHTPCQKKASSTITDHDCCGRCNAGRAHLQESMANYAGPGDFAHDYWEAALYPGVCATCGLDREAH